MYGSAIRYFERGLGDPRVAGIIPMAEPIDDTQISETSEITVTIPILALSGSENAPELFSAQFEQATQQATQLDFTWVELIGGCHTTFGGLPLCATIDKDYAYTQINRYALSFARHILLDDQSTSTLNLLSGQTEVEGINVQRHIPTE